MTSSGQGPRIRRVSVALGAVHAARPKAIRDLTLDDVDLPNRHITLAGHRQLLGELTYTALLTWLEYRRLAWPRTANRHVLISRFTALGVVDLAELRERRALRRALDHLDSAGLCCCWILPRRCPLRRWPA